MVEGAGDEAAGTVAAGVACCGRVARRGAVVVYGIGADGRAAGGDAAAGCAGAASWVSAIVAPNSPQPMIAAERAALTERRSVTNQTSPAMKMNELTSRVFRPWIKGPALARPRVSRGRLAVQRRWLGSEAGGA